MGKPLAFFSFMGSTPKKTGPYFSPHKKTHREQNPPISGVFRDPHESCAMNFGQLEGVQPTSPAEDPEAFRIQLRLPLLQQVGGWLGGLGVVGESPYGLVKENWLIFFWKSWYRWFTSIFRSDAVCIIIVGRQLGYSAFGKFGALRWCFYGLTFCPFFCLKVCHIHKKMSRIFRMEWPWKGHQTTPCCKWSLKPCWSIYIIQFYHM